MESTITFEQMPKAVAQIQSDLEIIKKMILTKTENSISSNDELLTIQQASSLLSLAVPTIYGLVNRSAIPALKKGKRLYFLRDDLMNWLKEGRKQTIDEINVKAQDYINAKRKNK